MNPTRKMKREDLEVMLQYRTSQEKLLGAELVEEKLTQLQAFVGQLTATPNGRVELQLRTKRFGDCQRIDGETSGQFYSKLRHWLDRDMERPRPRRHGSGRTAD